MRQWFPIFTQNLGTLIVFAGGDGTTAVHLARCCRKQKAVCFFYTLQNVSQKAAVLHLTLVMEPDVFAKQSRAIRIHGLPFRGLPKENKRNGCKLMFLSATITTRLGMWFSEKRNNLAPCKQPVDHIWIIALWDHMMSENRRQHSNELYMGRP